MTRSGKTEGVLPLRGKSSSGMGPLAWRESFRLKCKVPGRARGSLPEGAGKAVRLCLREFVPIPSREKWNPGASADAPGFRNYKIFFRCNDDDRRQRRKQGGVVGAAASKTRVPPKARSGCWVPQPGRSGGHSKSFFAAKPLQKTTRNAIFQRSYVNKLEISKNCKIF